jgi:hypothetical protein
MEKRTLLAVVLVVFAGAAAFFVMRAPEKGQRKGPPPRPIAEFKGADVTGLEVWNDKQQHAVLEKSGSDWRVKDPGDWKADQSAVKMLTDGLEKLSFGDVVTENKAKHDEMGVADGKTPRVLAKGAGGKTLADLYIGKTMGGYTMARLNGKDDVWQSSGLFPYAVNKEPKAWRDHTIFDLAGQDVDKLTVEGAGSKLVLEKAAAKDAKPGEAAKWKIAESTGTGPKTSDVLDEAQVNGAIQALSTLHAGDFVDDKKKEDVAVKPQLTVTIAIKGAAHTLFVGEQKGDDFTVATSDSPTVYTVKKYALDRIAKKPIDYRDKTLVKAAEADIASLQITSGTESTTLTQGKDGKWTVQKGTADDTKVKPVVGAFANLQADSFSDEKDFAKTGLQKPAGGVIVSLKDKKTVGLKIGATTKEGDYYVQKTGSPDIYLVKKFAVDRFLKKPTELTKK